MACFEEACDLDTEAQAAFVERLAAEDPALAKELSSLLHHDRESPFGWLLCVDDPELAFAVTDPCQFFPAYRPELDVATSAPSRLARRPRSRSWRSSGRGTAKSVSIWPRRSS